MEESPYRGQKGKRHRGMDSPEVNKKNKRQSNHGADMERQIMPIMPMPEDTAYRLLCQINKIGSIMGKGGNIMKALKQRTHARIKVTEPMPGVDERIVLIWSSPRELERYKENGRSKKDRIELDDGMEELDFICPAQEALFEIHSRITSTDDSLSDENGANDDSNSEENPDHEVTARLLVPNIQIGCLLGKGGKIIEKMRMETGAQIKILHKEHLPPCALPTDELVQVSGDPSIVKKALYEISARIFENPLIDRPNAGGSFSGAPPEAFAPPTNFMPFGHPMSGPPMNLSRGFGPPPGPPLPGPPPLGLHFGGAENFGSIEPWGTKASAPLDAPPVERWDRNIDREFAIQMLCPEDRVGFVIGKGGSALRQLRDVTRARVRVDAAVPGSDERIVHISADEVLEERISPVIEAALQLQTVCNATPEREGQVTTRLLVPSKQIGCLLGRKGSVITEMRKKTSASIKVLHKPDLPKCAKESDEPVLVGGEYEVAREALIEVLTRLRENALREPNETKGGGFTDSGQSIHQPIDDIPQSNAPISYIHPSGRRDRDFESAGGMFALNGTAFGGSNNMPSTFRDLRPLEGLGSDAGMFSTFSDTRHSKFSTGFDNLAPASMSGPGQLHSVYSSGPGRDSGIGSLPRNIAGSNVELFIPGDIAFSVLGRGNANISKICEISGAEIKVCSPIRGTGNRVVEIYGNPEQTQAAQSLLQAFIISS